MNEKQAGGDLLGRFAGLVSRPFVGAAKSQAVQDGVVNGVTKYVNNPIESGLRRSGVHKLISKVYEHGTYPIPGTPKLMQPIMPDRMQRRAYGNWRADDHIHTLAHNPELVGALAVPLPGVGETYLATKHLATKALGGVKKLAAYAPSFADELEKISCGDMLQYFQDHPQKLKEKQERDRKKELIKTAAAKLLRKTVMEPKETLHCPHCDDELPERGGVYRRPDGMYVHTKCKGEFEWTSTPEQEETLREFKERWGKTKEAQVSPYQQKTQWTCSAACLKAVLAHYGQNIPEMQLIEAIGAKKGRGAECDEIAAAARKLGFDAFEYSFESIDQAKSLTDADMPIICDIQSFNNPGKGHYVVMTAIDDQVHLMDPNTPTNERVISREEMDERWWDRAMAPPHSMMPKWGIIVLPKEST